MADLPPLDPCTADKRGRHELGVVTPEDDHGDMTLFCSHCGVVRRLPVLGALSRSLDAEPADVIAAAVEATRRPPE